VSYFAAAKDCYTFQSAGARENPEDNSEMTSSNRKTRRRAAGEGLVRQRSDGRWEARIDLGYVKGKRTRRTYYGRTQAEVLDKLTKARATLKLGLPVAVDRQTVREFLLRWLEDSVAPRVKPRTYERFAELIRLHISPLLGNIRLEKLSPAHVQRLITIKREEGLSPQTVVSIRNVLRNGLNQALRWGITARNVATLVDVPRIERPAVHVFSVDEARRFLEAAHGEPFEALYCVALALGLRKGEICALSWKNIDLDAARLSVINSLQRIRNLDPDPGSRKTRLEIVETKTQKSQRTVSLPQYAVRALRSHRVRQIEAKLAVGAQWPVGVDLVFTNQFGRPLEPVNLHRAYKRLLKKAGLPNVRFHDLRHSAASLMLAQGVPLKTIQEILGHCSIAVTSGFYAHLGEQLKREAADAMDRVLGY